MSWGKINPLCVLIPVTMSEKTNYTNYELADFLDDQQFISWVKGGNPTANSFWQEWMKTNPKNIHIMEEAVDILQCIYTSAEITVPEGIAENIYQRISDSIQDQKKPVLWEIKGKKIALVTLAAASIIFIILFAPLFNTSDAEMINIKTAFGEYKEITLPDSTQISLNANTSIHFNTNISATGSREIWLDNEGEMFLKVKHINKNPNKLISGDAFIVHTPSMTIQVLGTSFNVKKRRGISTITLENGSVKVIVTNDTLQQAILEPGESAILNEKTNKLNIIRKNSQQYTSWRSKKLLLENSSVEEIIHQIEDMYGCKILLENAQIGKRKLDGQISLKNIDNILFILTNTLNLSAEKINGSTYILKPR